MAPGPTRTLIVEGDIVGGGGPVAQKIEMMGATAHSAVFRVSFFFRLIDIRVSRSMLEHIKGALENILRDMGPL